MEADEYLKLAQVEDSMWYFRALHGHIRRALRCVTAPAAAVLDAGCGTGGLALKLRAEHPDWRYSGIDVSPLAVDFARRRCGPGADLRQGSIEAMPYDAESFDAVISADVINHVDDPMASLREFHRVLRPGGVVAINLAAYMWLWSYHDEACHTKHRYVRREIAAQLADAGFESVQTTHWNLFALPLVVVKRKLLRGARETSDVKSYPALVEWMFSTMAAVELAWLRTGVALPFGTSVFAVARKFSRV